MVEQQSEIEKSPLLRALELGEQAIRDGDVVEYNSEVFNLAVQRGKAKSQSRKKIYFT